MSRETRPTPPGFDEQVQRARELAGALEGFLQGAARHLAARCAVDGRMSAPIVERHQAVVYDLASISSAVAAAGHLAAVADRDEVASLTALAYAADVAADVRSRVTGREEFFGLPSGLFDGHLAAITAGRDPALLCALAEHVLATGEAGARHLPEDVEVVRQVFRRFTDEQITPLAQQVHRDDADVPEAIIAGLGALGGFGLTIPESYGGVASGDGDLLAMLVVTEELSRGSLALGGSLITRPEIIGSAILRGGTEEQKDRWLPGIASGERMCAVAVTEPGVGSDVAKLACTARRDDRGWVIDGVKTWCTFAGRADHLLVLARTDADRGLGARGLSLFMIDKAPIPGHSFRVESPRGGHLEGRAIPTLGYRGMHSFEVSFDGWRVPADALVGGEAGLGRGFALQMEGFANGRLQTAGRAQGVMQAAIEQAVSHVQAREVFGSTLADLDLTRTKLARMAASLAACRAMSSAVASHATGGQGAEPFAASQAKQVACRAAEWVTREAQQLHGGYGYAEEFAVSRLFVDARVLSIFEGADEVLALRVIGRHLLADALTSSVGSSGG